MYENILKKVPNAQRIYSIGNGNVLIDCKEPGKDNYQDNMYVADAGGKYIRQFSPIENLDVLDVASKSKPTWTRN